MSATSAEELTPQQESELRADLCRLRDALRQQIESSADAASPVDLDEPIGRVSRMDAIAQQRMVQANREAGRSRLQQVGAALSRMDDGEYGECLSCGEPVGLARLRVKPEAALCIACQSLRETRAP